MSASPLSLAGLGDSLLGESLLDKLHEAREDLFGHSYASTSSEEANAPKTNAISHLLSRGHEGKVLCISASTTVDFIVSGGEDHTMRIWEYDASGTLYEFEMDGQCWKGFVRKEADVAAEGEDIEGRLDMTHQLELYPAREGGRRDHRQRRYLWVRFEGNTLTDENGHNQVPFTTTVTHEATDSYKLSAVLVHDLENEQNQTLIDGGSTNANPEEPDSCPNASQSVGVTAVACAGMVGPFISGTSNGSVHFLRLPKAGGNVESLRDLGIGPINDLDVAELDDRNDVKFIGPWVLAVAGHAGRVRLIQLCTAGCLQWVEYCEPLEHDAPVRKVRQVRDAGAFGVRFATCAGEAVYLWNLEGALLTRLSLWGVPRMVDLTVTNRDSGTLLFAGHGGHIGVWVIDPASSELPSEPLTIYRYKGRGIDVDQGSDLAEYAVHIREGDVIVTWDLLAARPENLISPESLSKWWELLIRPGKESFVAEMRHHAPVTDFKVAEDDVEGPVLLSASTDGTVYTWSMKKGDRGEICAQMRSLTFKEIALPPGLLLMTVFQLCSFAFGPSTAWRRTVKETIRFGEKIAFFGTELDMELDIKRSDKFWWELLMVYRIMLLFVLFEAVGAQELLDYAKSKVQSSSRFKAAELEGRFGYMHFLRRVLAVLQALLSLMTWFCCTVGVAPVFKVCAQAMRCSQDGDRYYLDVTGGHTVECSMLFGTVPISLRWEGYTVWAYSPLLIFCLAMVYLAGMAPYAVVGGDSSYVQRDEILDRRAWAFNAERKATAVNLGVFHPNPRHVFKSHLVEMVSKALLPLITWVVAHPLLQMSLSTLLMAALYAESMAFPAFIDRTYCVIVQGSRLFALCTMMCGLITVVLGHELSALPVLLLLLSFVTVGALTAYRASLQKAWSRSVFQRTTRLSREAPPM
uniref:Uncharacterized protein n=1 Tax=Alexandrium catenella TaxID=2925 RepID=A0A7S1QNG9_ALECA|mmetsp:Transcript_35738/g.97016  ORF Transcript_35738/g.97016 Transcript_35738/m.97016 type:complete len:916 (+) Transcript_35738:51-2798(+)